jgi:predicted dienelactone hydrolase
MHILHDILWKAGPLFLGLLALAAGPAAAQTGLTQLTLAGLPVTLVYPTVAPGLAETFGPFVVAIARDAPPPAGPRRLVLLSHGTGGHPMAEHALAARLAAAGFVVAQPLHQGDNAADPSGAGPVSWRRRPQEASAVIDGLAAHPVWGPLLQLDRVGVHGTSAGAVTALTLAGAEWRLRDLVRHCLAAGEADLGFCYTGAPDAASRAARLASYERIRAVPDAALGAEFHAAHGGADPRIAAVAVSIPVAAIFAPASLARLPLPVGVTMASDDRLTANAFHAEHLLRHCRGCVLLARMQGAEHMDFMAPWPEGVARAAAARFPIGGSPAPGFDPAQREAAYAAIVAHFERRLLP